VTPFDRDLASQIFDQCEHRVQDMDQYGSQSMYMTEGDSVKIEDFVKVYVQAIAVLRQNIENKLNYNKSIMVEQSNNQNNDADNKKSTGPVFYAIVKQGENLRNQKYPDVTKMCVKIQVGGEKNQKRSQPATNVQDPVWEHENLKFDLMGSEISAIVSLLAVDKNGKEVLYGESNYDLRSITDQKFREREKIVFHDDDGREIEGHLILSTQYITNHQEYTENMSDQYTKLIQENNDAIVDFSDDLIILYRPFVKTFFPQGETTQTPNNGIIQSIKDVKSGTVQETEALRSHLAKYRELFKEYPSLVWLVVWICLYN